MKREKQIIRISVYGIIVNLILVAFKATVGLISGSIAIILDALNHLSDALSAILTIIGTFLSAKKPDKKHPYGHGRIEYLASIAISAIVLLTGVEAFYESVKKIISPQPAVYSVATILVVVAAIFVKLIFGRFVLTKGKSLNSGSLIATGTDALSDAALSASTLIGIFISLIFKISPEGYIGALISIMILRAAYDIMRQTLDEMIGIRVDKQLTDEIKSAIAKIDKHVLGVYDLSIHSYGPNKLVGSAHIQVDDDLRAREIHHITKNIEYGIYEKFNIILTVGIYASNSTGKSGRLRQYLEELLKDYPQVIQMHGFYADSKLKVVTFDLIFDFDEQNPDQVAKEISAKMQEKYPGYQYHYVIDTDVTE